jgi:hypothetical protein
MKRKAKLGRPKLPKELKKVGFSMKVKPELWAKIKTLKYRNSELESILEKSLLQKDENIFV